MPFLSSHGRRMVFREDIPPRALAVTSLPRDRRGTFPTLQMWSSREIWSWEQSLCCPCRGGAVGRGWGLLAGARCPLTLEYSFWPEVVWQKKVQGKEWSYPV